MLSYYLELILQYLVRRIGFEVMDWSLRKIVEWFRANPEADRACATESIERYMSEYDPDRDGFFWERKH